MITLFHSPISQHSRRVVSLLEEAGIEYEAKIVDMMAGEYLSEAFLAINPNHQVPTLIDGDIKIHESNAILRYLCNKHQLNNWYPTELASRAQVEQWLDWTQCRFSSAVVDIVLNKVFLGDKGDAQAIERGQQQMIELTQILDDQLSSQPYLCGQQPTIADLALASNVFHLGLAQARPDTKNINDWFGRISELKGFQKSLPKM